MNATPTTVDHNATVPTIALPMALEQGRAGYLATIGHEYDGDSAIGWGCLDCPTGDAHATRADAENACLLRWAAMTDDEVAGQPDTRGMF